MFINSSITLNQFDSFLMVVYELFLRGPDLQKPGPLCSHLVVLFGGALGSVASQEEACHWAQVLRVSNLTSLPIIYLLGHHNRLCELSASGSGYHASCHDGP